MAYCIQVVSATLTNKHNFACTVNHPAQSRDLSSSPMVLAAREGARTIIGGLRPSVVYHVARSIGGHPMSNVFWRLITFADQDVEHARRCESGWLHARAIARLTHGAAAQEIPRRNLPTRQTPHGSQGFEHPSAPRYSRTDRPFSSSAGCCTPPTVERTSGGPESLASIFSSSFPVS